MIYCQLSKVVVVDLLAFACYLLQVLESCPLAQIIVRNLRSRDLPRVEPDVGPKLL
jgi:hypothetical protein